MNFFDPLQMLTTKAYVCVCVCVYIYGHFEYDLHILYIII